LCSDDHKPLDVSVTSVFTGRATSQSYVSSYPDVKMNPKSDGRKGGISLFLGETLILLGLC